MLSFLLIFHVVTAVVPIVVAQNQAVINDFLANLTSLNLTSLNSIIQNVSTDPAQVGFFLSISGSAPMTFFAPNNDARELGRFPYPPKKS